MKKVLAAFARNTVFANILLILVIIAGLIATFSMIRENFPEFSLDMISISVLYPGADPEEVEEGISQKIEEALEGLEGIKLYTTKSSENIGTAMIEVKENYAPDDVLDRIRNQVNAISTFPTDAEKPVISEITLKDAVSLLYLSGEMTERQLKEWSENIKDELQKIPSISQVVIFGTRDYEIAIEVAEERLKTYGLTFDAVVAAVRRGNLNLAGGTLRTKDEEIRLRTMGRKYTAQELSSIIVVATPQGEMLPLDKIATIKDGFTEDPVLSKINGERAVLVIVYKTHEEDALKISKYIKTFIKKKKQEIPKGAHIDILYDNTSMLTARINLLLRNGAIGLCLVFFILWLFLDFRLSFWGSMGIPISISGAMVLLWWIGGTINMISLFSLIMVLGIIVDDAIVVGESIYVHRKNGEPPLTAAVEGVAEVGLPVLAAILTTIVAFVPLAYVGGIMGKFISILPTVVIACLVVSLLECLMLLPAHLSHLPDLNQKPKQGFLRGGISRIQRFTSQALELFVTVIYTPFLKKALEWRYISFCSAITVLLITIGLVNSGIIKFEVFPEIDGFVITATVEFPSGTPLTVTEEAIRKVDEAIVRIEKKTPTLTGDPLIVDRLTLIGQTLSEDMNISGPHVGSVQVILLPSEKRGVHTKDLQVAWEKEIGRIPGIKSLTFTGMAAGPPGAPIEIWLQGLDMEKILAAADHLMNRLKQFDGVTQVRSDFSPGKNEIRLALKPTARPLGLTVESLARQINAAYYGDEALRIQRGRDNLRIKVRYPANERNNLSDLNKTRIRTPQGKAIPLASVADISFSPGYSTITRTNGLRRVVVSAGIDSNKANANEVFAELSQNYFEKLSAAYPTVRVSLQGEKKKMRESFDSLKIGFPMALLGIFIIIATMFRSYVQPFVIMFTVPFGIIGGVFGHLLLGYDLSIMSIFGMVALTGVVVNDAIVLIDGVNRNLAKGMAFKAAIIKGGQRRFRAIFLTTVSTVGGLAALILETDLQARFLIPMAISIAAGVAFATILTLVLIPSLLVIMNDLRLLVHFILHGSWLTREAAEPARQRYENTYPGA